MSASTMYPPVARDLCDRLGADGLALVIINGNMGSGCCVAEMEIPKRPPAEVRALLVRNLRKLADHIEREDTSPTDPNN